MSPQETTEYQAINSPDVLLVLPPLYHTGRVPDTNPKEPMGLMYLAASLREDQHNVTLFDADIEARSIDQTTNKILKENPRIVGFSVLQRALPSFELIVRGLREKGFNGHITCGGITPSLSFPYILERLGDKVDSLVIGEGEQIVRSLTKNIINGSNWRETPGIAYLNSQGLQVVNKPIDMVDLDSLPFASRDYLPYCLTKTNYATMLGSRGCWWGSCSFCSNNAFERQRGGSSWRGRNPISIADEMEQLYEQYGVSVFKFNDPNIFSKGKEGRDHVIKFCQEVVKRKLPLHLMGFCRGDDITTDPKIVDILKSGGFERLLLGVESSDNEILKKFRKGETVEGMEKALDILHQAQISTVIGFMIFNPYTTVDSLKRDLQFLRKRGECPTLSKAMRVFDGTPIQPLLEAEGRLNKRNPFEGYHEYEMPRDIAAIYGSMKTLFTLSLDRIRAVGQDKIWDIKKTGSFRDRQDFNSLAAAFFSVESFLLDNLIAWTETGDFNQETVNETANQVYEKLRQIGDVIGVNVNEVIVDQNTMAKEIYRMMKERPWTTFPEEYRWNAD